MTSVEHPRDWIQSGNLIQTDPTGNNQELSAKIHRKCIKKLRWWTGDPKLLQCPSLSELGERSAVEWSPHKGENERQKHTERERMERQIGLSSLTIPCPPKRVI